MMRAMSNPSIIPSAQRLAEANNVNWRTLQGSGDGGSVVERDVLAHLARVMMGEEETNPTPEPLPEGMRAWPEELERRKGQEASAASETAPEPPAEPTAGDTAADDSPWSLEPSAPDPTTTPVSGGWDDDPSLQAEAEPEAEYAFAPDVQADPDADASVRFEAAGGYGTDDEADNDTEHVAEYVAEYSTDSGDDSAAELVGGVSEEVYQVALDELEMLRARTETLEEERSQHLSELRKLPELQKTTEIQQTELAKLGILQSEIGGLKDQLAAAQTEVQRVHELTALNQDLEARLERAREFKDGAKAELERIMGVNKTLEAQLAASAKPKRPWWRFGG